jgi:lipopolysaccharide/colanic/teichoic acid biosynthesis glycosyltransferase
MNAAIIAAPASQVRPAATSLERIRYWRSSRRRVPRSWAIAKRAIDIGAGGAFLLAALPLSALVALAIKIVSPGPVFFAQVRVGKDGRLFKMYKFRTMVDGAHLLRKHVAHLNETDGPALKIPNDPRLHPLGALLRRGSLDELPQLWNVLLGDMSLVGPRPALPREVKSYLPHYHQRLTVQPGMTGLWQVSGRTNIPFRRWMAMDVWYATHHNPLLDLRLLARTVPAVFRREGAW